MGTENIHWMNLWLGVILINDTYKDRTIRVNEIILEKLAPYMRQLFTFGRQVQWNQDQIENYLNGKKEDKDRFSQDTVHTTPEGKRRRKD